MDEEKKNLDPEAVAEEKPAAAEENSADEAAAPETAEEKDTKKDSRKSRKEARREAKAEAKKEDAPEPVAETVVSKDAYLRLMAEYDNFRKRSQKEKDDLYAIVKAESVTKFLPVYDNLERALAAETADEAYRKGVEMIMAQFKQTLEKLGVTEIECIGQQFNPELHNAVMHVDDETKGDNEIVEVFQKGFMLGDRVIRFAMVKVAN